jgi:hypothetical protein
MLTLAKVASTVTGAMIRSTSPAAQDVPEAMVKVPVAEDVKVTEPTLLVFLCTSKTTVPVLAVPALATLPVMPLGREKARAAAILAHSIDVV